MEVNKIVEKLNKLKPILKDSNIEKIVPLNSGGLFISIGLGKLNKFVCASGPKNCYNIHGEYIGVDPERGLFYSKSIGKHRVYRRSLNDKELSLFKFSNKQEAQGLCNHINKIYNDIFEVVEI